MGDTRPAGHARPAKHPGRAERPGQGGRPGQAEHARRAGHTRQAADIARGDRRALGWVALIAVWFFWGTTYDAIRVGVRDMPPLLFAGTRYLAAALILLPVAARGRAAAPGRVAAPGRAAGERRFTLVNWRSAVIIGGLMLFGGNGLLTVGEQTVPAGVAALLVATVPLWLVAMDAVVSRRMIRLAVAAGLVLGLTGIVVLVHPTASQRLNTGSVALVLLGSACWAAGSLYSRTAPAPSQPFLATSMQMLAGALVIFAAATVTGEWADLHIAHLSGNTLLALLWLILPGSVVGLTAYIYALRALPTASVSTYAFVNPIVAVLIAWPLLGERPTVQTAVAGAIIVASVALILHAGARH